MALTQEKIDQIRKLLDANLSQQKIGEIVGVAQPTVSIIARALGRGRKRGMGSPSLGKQKAGK